MSAHGRVPKILDLKRKNELEEYIATSRDEGYDNENVKRVLEANGFEFEEEHEDIDEEE